MRYGANRYYAPLPTRARLEVMRNTYSSAIEGPVLGQATVLVRVVAFG
jgi:hypothetical protein